MPAKSSKILFNFVGSTLPEMLQNVVQTPMGSQRLDGYHSIAFYGCRKVASSYKLAKDTLLKNTAWHTKAKIIDVVLL